MYRVSPFVRHFANALLGGIALATIWVNISPSSYYDAIEFRLADLPLPDAYVAASASLTPMSLVSGGLMAFFMFFIGKELWEALVLERGALAKRSQAVIPLGAVIGGIAGAVAVWLWVSGRIETAQEASFGIGWPVPIGSDVVLCYFFARAAFGPFHPAMHFLLLITIAFDISGLLAAGIAFPDEGLHPLWLLLSAAAVAGVWLGFGRLARPGASERAKRRSMALTPYVIAGALCWTGFVLAGLPGALGLLPLIPVIPHADHAFGLFAEAEEFLHDPLNRLSHLLAPPMAWVLFLFGLTRGGIDLGALAPTTLTLLAAMWIGKPVGLIAGAVIAALVTRIGLPRGMRWRELPVIALISGCGFTVPALALDGSLPGGEMAEAARLGLALSLVAGPVAMVLARLARRSPTF